MNTNRKYRIVALLLVLVFSVFNIGIPIVLAECPLAKMVQGGMCPACDDGAKTADRVTTEQNTACCATKIVAERNTTEFLQSNAGTHDLTNGVVAHPLHLPVPTPINHSSMFIVYYPPAPSRCEDIPIFVSSLLI
jgi:hypothetical protein